MPTQNKQVTQTHLLEVLYVEHLNQGVDSQRFKNGIDGSRPHVSTDILLQAQHSALGLKLTAVAAYHVPNSPERGSLYGHTDTLAGLVLVGI